MSKGNTKTLYWPERRCWTVEEFDRAGREGIFRYDERLELIEGEVFTKVSPQESPHSTGIRLVEVALNHAFPRGYDVRVQMPLVFGTRNKPEPDVAVVTGTIRDYAHRHPTTAVLVVEVSDSTLRIDRTTKAALYARAGIEEYWILNLVDRVLEVYREPAQSSGHPLGYAYRSLVRYSEADQVSPLGAPQTILAVADLLP